MRRRKQIYLLFILTLFLFSGKVYAAENYVIGRIDWISEASAKVRLEWKRPDPRNLMITGWQMSEDKVLNIYYQESGGKEYRERIVTIEENAFPARIRLIHSAKAPENRSIFKDMTGIAERDEAIVNLYYQGIVGGYPDGTFLPDKHVSRAEFAKILCEALMLPQKKEGDALFWDIKANWAKGYIVTLAEKGFVKGKADGRFDPDGSISLGEIFALLDRSFYLYGRPFTDNSLSKHWSNTHYLAMKGQSVIRPQDDIYGSYPADRPATRAEVALFLSRILEQRHDRR